MTVSCWFIYCNLLLSRRDQPQRFGDPSGIRGAADDAIASCVHVHRVRVCAGHIMFGKERKGKFNDGTFGVH